MTSDASSPIRRRWGVALQAIEPSRVHALAEQLTQRFTTRHRSVPTAGLGMLQMRDGALDQRFHVGEFPCSSSHVTVKRADGQEAEGGAHLMVDDAELAASVAICDAVLAAGWEGADRVAALVAEGAAQLEQRDGQRRAMLVRTTVDFALLNQTLDEGTP